MMLASRFTENDIPSVEDLAMTEADADELKYDHLELGEKWWIFSVRSIIS